MLMEEPFNPDILPNNIELGFFRWYSINYDM